MPLSLPLNELSIAVFLLLLAAIMWWDRENIERYSIVFVRRTKRGIDYLDRLAEAFPRGWTWWATLGVGVGFVGMAAVFLLILKQTLKLFLVGGATPPVAPVLPTVSTVTTPQESGFLGLPFWPLLISLTVVLFAHEGMHGVIARVEDFDIESVGLILLGIIPGAFVQPEGQRDFFDSTKSEISLDRANPEDSTSPEEDGAASPWGEGSALSRLRVMAAGPMANITVAALLFLLLHGAFTTAHGTQELRGFYTHNGMEIVNVSGGSPADAAGLQPGMVVTRIGNHSTTDIRGFRTAAETLTANETVAVMTQGNGTFTVTLGRKPPPEGNISYTPAPIDPLLVGLEKQFPGTIQRYETFNDMLFAEDTTVRIGRWRWIQQHEEGLDRRAAKRIAELEAGREQGDDGFMGIRVVARTTVKEGLEPLVEPLFHIFRLLFFIAILNFMIGLANLLPIKGLDGGWMLDTVLQEWVPEHADGIVRHVTAVTLGMVLISFLFLIWQHLP